MLPSQWSSDDKCTTIPIICDQDATIKMEWLARLECLFPRHLTIIMRGSHHFPQIYDSAAVASTIRSFWDEEIAA